MESPDLAPEPRNRTESSCSTASTSDMDGIDLFPLTDLENNNSNNIKVRTLLTCFTLKNCGSLRMQCRVRLIYVFTVIANSS